MAIGKHSVAPALARCPVVEVLEPRMLLTAYYVSASAGTGGDGSISKPFQTIQAAANIVSAGDVVNIAGGTYTNQVTVTRSGTATSPITFQRQSGTVTISVAARFDSDAGVFVNGARNLIFDGIGVKDVTPAGSPQDLQGYRIIDAENVTVKNVHTQDTKFSGLLARDSKNITVLDSYFQNAGSKGETGSNENVTLMSVAGFLVKGNTIAGGGREGLCVKGFSSNGSLEDNVVHGMSRLGIYVSNRHAALNNITVDRNVVYGTGAFGITLAIEEDEDPAGKPVGYTNNVKIRNNIVYNNAKSGIIIARYGADGLRKDILIENNTSYGNGVGTSNFAVGILVESSNVENIRVRNNIAMDNRSGQIAKRKLTTGQIPVTSENNIIWGAAAGTASWVNLGELEADSRFVDAAHSDFRLNSTSPAIDYGTLTEAPADDFLRNPREGLPDAGAYEYVAPGYPLGFTWDREADWTPGTVASSSQGNPDDDANGQPTWNYEYATGDALASADPWYKSARTALVWDPDWWGAPGVWAKAVDVGGAAASDRLVHVLNAAGRDQIPVARWSNPSGEAQTLDITATVRFNWVNGASGDAEIALVNLTEAGEFVPLYTATRNSSGGGWQILSFSIPSLHVEAGGAILLSVRGQGTTGSVALYDDVVLTIDPDAPAVASTTVNDGNVQRSMVNTLTVRFSENVTLAPDAVSLLYSDGSAIPGLSIIAANPSGDGRTWEISFPDSPLIGGSLPDGSYNLAISAAGVRDLSSQTLAGDYSYAFHRLFGDSDGDRDVDGVDLGAFRRSYVWYFDFDGNGMVTDSDQREFTDRLLGLWTLGQSRARLGYLPT